MRFLPLVAIALLFAGCAPKVVHLYDDTTANTRAREEYRMRKAMTMRKEDIDSDRWGDVVAANPTKDFNLAAMNDMPATAKWLGSRSNEASKFGYSDRTRARDFAAGGYNSKGAWMGDAKYSTKSATVTKSSWFSRLTTRTKGNPAGAKGHDTRTATEAPRAVPVLGVHDGERPFLNQGRRQAEFNRKGPDALPVGYAPGYGNAGPAWSGELSEVKTIDDVKALLNKN